MQKTILFALPRESGCRGRRRGDAAVVTELLMLSIILPRRLALDVVVLCSVQQVTKLSIKAARAYEIGGHTLNDVCKILGFLIPLSPLSAF